MTRPAAALSEDLRRVPGLFRRWELPDVFEPHRQYLLEEAGAHADGTPLYAIYATVGAIAVLEDSDPGDRSVHERDT